MKNKKFSILLLINLLISVNIFAQGSFPLFIEAENMAVKSTGSPSDGGWLLENEGYVSTTVEFTTDSYYSFKVRVKGVQSSNQLPFLEVQIDNLVCGPIVVENTQYDYYTISSEVSAGTHQVSLAYVNDEYSGRSLTIDNIEIDVTTNSDYEWLVRLADTILLENPNPASFPILDWIYEIQMIGVAKAYDVTGDSRYFDFVLERLDSHVDDQGNLDVEITSIPGIMLIWLYYNGADYKFFLAAEKVADYMIYQYPRTDDGAFVHLPEYMDQLWIDTLGGLGRFFGLMGHVTGDNKYFNEGANQIILQLEAIKYPATTTIYGFSLLKCWQLHFGHGH